MASIATAAAAPPLAAPECESPAVSIIVPTYREALNIPLLARGIDDVLAPRATPYELIIVDDHSDDGTGAACEQLLSEGNPVRLISRRHQRGLSSAVLEGCGKARGTYLVVMDGDLSHPCSAIPAMLDHLQSGDADFVVGSRYVPGGSTHANWGWFRTINSRVPSWLSRPLSPLRDPMSGFFALPRDSMPERQLLSPVGYKIGLEIFVKGDFDKPKEVPIHFGERVHGESKLSAREQLRFLQHLRRLYHFHFPLLSELVQFGLVGASGFVIDLLFYLLLQWLAGLSHTTARALSFLVAASWNWGWNRTITFSQHQQLAKLVQWPRFLLTSSLGFAVNWGSYVLLTSEFAFFDQNRILALMAGVALGMGVNFITARLFVFKPFAEDVKRDNATFND